MGTINIHSVKNDLEERGWELLSTEYKNLKTPLEMLCPKKHNISVNYDEWRKNYDHLCQECMRGIKSTIIRNIVPAKKVGTKRLLALDAATKTTGWAIYDKEQLVSYGHINIQGDNANRRIHDLKLRLVDFIIQNDIDVIAFEHIFLEEEGIRNVELYRILANLQGVLIDTFLSLGKKYFLARASEWRKTCSISEKKRDIVKQRAVERAIQWFSIDVTQDEAEAICLGKHITKHYWAELGIEE